MSDDKKGDRQSLNACPLLGDCHLFFSKSRQTVVWVMTVPLKVTVTCFSEKLRGGGDDGVFLEIFKNSGGIAAGCVTAETVLIEKQLIGRNILQSIQNPNAKCSWMIESK